MHTRREVTLREFDEADLPAIERWATEPEIAGELALGSDAATWLAQVAADKDRRPRSRWLLAIDLPEVSNVGAVMLSVDSRHDRRAEIGFAVQSDQRNQGIAVAALGELVGLAAEEGFHRLWAVCDPANHASQKVLERSGFAAEGRLRGDRRTATGWRDSLVYGRIVADEIPS